MKTTHLLAALIAATIPLTAVRAEEAGQTETSDQKQEQTSDTMGMKGKMMSNWKEQDAELDKLVAEMNNAPADKKLDAVAAVLTKLVEQRKAMHGQMQKMMAVNEKGMGMCRMMMGMDKEGDDHSKHH
jgi:hydrogenase maturation factor HypE